MRGFSFQAARVARMKSGAGYGAVLRIPRIASGLRTQRPQDLLPSPIHGRGAGGEGRTYRTSPNQCATALTTFVARMKSGAGYGAVLRIPRIASGLRMQRPHGLLPSLIHGRGAGGEGRARRTSPNQYATALTTFVARMKSGAGLRGCTTDSPDCIRATDAAPTGFAPLSHSWERSWGRGPIVSHFAKPVRHRLDHLRSPDEIRGRATGLYYGFPGLHPGYGWSARTVCSPLPFMGEGPGERGERAALRQTSAPPH